MVIVSGSIEAREAHRDDVLRLSLAHVARSRLEPGCISHSVSIDADNPNRLVFFEQWASLSALQTHFRVPESGLFVKEVTALAEQPPQMAIYRAEPLAGDAV